jgi:hypothetical protein
VNKRLTLLSTKEWLLKRYCSRDRVSQRLELNEGGTLPSPEGAVAPLIPLAETPPKVKFPAWRDILNVLLRRICELTLRRVGEQDVYV